MSGLAAPLRALVTALAAVALAWLWFNDQIVLAVLAGVAPAAAGIFLDAIGRAMLPKQPTMAVRFLEWWILTPMAIAAAAGAAVVVVTVALAVPDGADIDPAVKELIGTLSTGLVAFVTAAFIDWAGDEKDSRLADHIQNIFEAKYKHPTEQGKSVFLAGSDDERWVYGNEFKGVEGWGRGARLKRAQGIADALKELQEATP